MRLVTIFEKTKTGWSAYTPGLPGLGVAGATMPETRELLRQAIEMHLEDLHKTGRRSDAFTHQTRNLKLSTSH